MKKVILGLLLAMPLGAVAQRPGTVTWLASAEPVNKQGALLIDVTAQIEKGWHIYASSQPAGGPIPLRIAVEPGTPYEVAGNITGTVPQKHHDTSFDLETRFYTDSFTLKVPVKVISTGTTSVPLAVRFQMCSDTTCMPPKTVHLVAVITSP
jgi:Disulphide bond corrector protein DsbC